MISSIGQYGNYASSYRINDIPKVNNDSTLAANKPKIKTEPAEIEAVSLTQNNRSRSADIENVSLTFNKNDDFDYLGKEAPIDSLDMKKAISDMKKDSILKDYQYFVGSAHNLSLESEDGKVVIR